MMGASNLVNSPRSSRKFCMALFQFRCSDFQPIFYLNWNHSVLNSHFSAARWFYYLSICICFNTHFPGKRIIHVSGL